MYLKIPKNSIVKMAIIKTDCIMTLPQVVQKYKCKYVINGGLYNMKTGKVSDIPLRINGETIATSSDGYWMIAWNEGPDICMIHSSEMHKWKNAVACSAMLKDGQEVWFHYTSAQGGIRGRTAFGDDDNNVHFVVTTDKKEPMSPTALRSKCKNNGMKNGIMLDSGGSSQLYNDGVYLYSEQRKVAYWIGIWTEEVDEEVINKPKCPYVEPTKNVSYGSRGNSAKWVQWYLKELGYYTVEYLNKLGNNYTEKQLEIDGIFGKGSKLALLEFQKDSFSNSKEHDGICGAKTRVKLKEAYAKK